MLFFLDHDTVNDQTFEEKFYIVFTKQVDILISRNQALQILAIS